MTKRAETEAAMLREWLGAAEKLAGPIRKRATKYPKVAKAVESLLSSILLAQARNVADGKKESER